MPSQYTNGANEHFVVILVLDWGFFFFVLSCTFSAPRHQGEIQGCPPRESLTLPFVSLSRPQRLCLIRSTHQVSPSEALPAA